MRSLRSWPAIMLVCERERENANPYIECTLILRNTLKVASSCVAIEQDRGQKIGRKLPIETRTRRRTRRKWKCTMKTLRKLESIKSPVASILEVKHFRHHIGTSKHETCRYEKRMVFSSPCSRATSQGICSFTTADQPPKIKSAHRKESGL